MIWRKLADYPSPEAAHAAADELRRQGRVARYHSVWLIGPTARTVYRVEQGHEWRILSSHVWPVPRSEVAGSVSDYLDMLRERYGHFEDLQVRAGERDIKAFGAVLTVTVAVARTLEEARSR